MRYIEKKAKLKEENIKVICPKCGEEAKTIMTKYGIKNICCNLWSWGNAPLVEAKVHKARIRAHKTFDKLWKSGLLTRTQAYGWLSKALNIPKNKCHMKKMDYDTARRVVTICRNFNQLKA